MNRFILEQYLTSYRVIMEKHAEKTHIYDKQTNEKEFNEDYSRECSISRSMRNIRRIAHSNEWEYFITLTIAPNCGCNRYVLDEVIDKMKKVFKDIKRHCKDFKYLLVCEQHPTSGAYHFHGLIYGIEEKYLYLNKYLHLQCLFFDNLGKVHNISPIKSHTAIANYITKYIKKDVCRDSNNRVYWCSRGLSKGERYEIDILNSLEVSQLFGFITEVVDPKSGEIVQRYYDTPFVAVRDFQFDSDNKYTRLVTRKDLQILFNVIEKKDQFKKLN